MPTKPKSQAAREKTMQAPVLGVMPSAISKAVARIAAAATPAARAPAIAVAKTAPIPSRFSQSAIGAAPSCRRKPPRRASMIVLAQADYDGAKRKDGSKVPAAVDTLGRLLALHVTPADQQDRCRWPT